jgi:MOSC domain-containing protein YiiM
VHPGSVTAIFVAAEAGAPARALEEVGAEPGHGLEGDRYRAGSGTFHKPGKPGQDITLIEAEALEAMAAEHGIALEAHAARRNVLTRGVSLDSLLGRCFAVGGVECVGVRPCDPCSHLERVTEPGVLRGLAGRGGLRADVVTSGRIRIGDEVRDLGPAVDGALARGPVPAHDEARARDQAPARDRDGGS